MASPTSALSSDIQELQLINFRDRNDLLGVLCGRFVSFVHDALSPEQKKVAQIALWVFAAISIVFGILSLPFGIFNGLSSVMWGAAAALTGVAMALKEDTEQIFPTEGMEKRTPKLFHDVYIQLGIMKKDMLLGTAFFTIPQIKLPLQDILEGKRDAEIFAHTHPIIKIEGQPAVVIRYWEYPVYSLWNRLNVLGGPRQKYAVFYYDKTAKDKTAAYASLNDFFVLRKNGVAYCHPERLMRFLKGELCLLPGHKKLIHLDKPKPKIPTKTE